MSLNSFDGRVREVEDPRRQELRAVSDIKKLLSDIEGQMDIATDRLSLESATRLDSIADAIVQQLTLILSQANETKRNTSAGVNLIQKESNRQIRVEATQAPYAYVTLLKYTGLKNNY